MVDDIGNLDDVAVNRHTVDDGGVDGFSSDILLYSVSRSGHERVNYFVV